MSIRIGDTGPWFGMAPDGATLPSGWVFVQCESKYLMAENKHGTLVMPLGEYFKTAYLVLAHSANKNPVETRVICTLGTGGTYTVELTK